MFQVPLWLEEASFKNRVVQLLTKIIYILYIPWICCPRLEGHHDDKCSHLLNNWENLFLKIKICSLYSGREQTLRSGGAPGRGGGKDDSHLAGALEAYPVIPVLTSYR